MQQELPSELIPQPVMLYLTSSDASFNHNSGYFNDVTYSFPRPLTCAHGYSFRISLYSLSLANTQTVICSYNNELTINGITSIVAPGNYSASALAESLAFYFPGVGVAFDEVGLKIVFAYTSPLTISGSLCSVLDIEPGTTGTTVSSKNNVNLSGSDIIDVEAIGISAESNLDVAGRRGMLCRIQNTTDSIGVLHYSDPDARQGTAISDRVLSSIRLRLSDDSRRPLLCTLPYTAAVKIEQFKSGAMDLRVDRPGDLQVPFK